MHECIRLDNLEIKKVIVVTLLRGKGTEDDICRKVYQYFDMEGNFLFEIDPCKNKKGEIQ